MLAVIRVYGASTTHRAWDWIRLREQWPSEIEWTAHWPDRVAAIRSEGSEYKAEPPENMREIWDEIQSDIRRSDCVLCYRQSADEVLRGALVECGMAIAMGKRVVLVSPLDPEGGSWRQHRLVHCVGSLDGARELLLIWSRRSSISQERAGWVCQVIAQSTLGRSDPADCGWPLCGCDPYANSVVSALGERAVRGFRR